MSFDGNHLRALSAQKASQARAKSFVKGSGSLPFVEFRQFLNGDYPFRIGPNDDTKNPFGYLYYRLHTLYDKNENAHKFQCPRSNNWDPLPQHWEDPVGVMFHSPSPKEITDMSLSPVFKERCWGCDTEAELVNEGFEDVSSLPGELGPWAKELLGNESWHFPVTFRGIEVASAEPRWQKNDGNIVTGPDGKPIPVIDKFSGKQVIDYTYRPAMKHDGSRDETKLLHCDLSLKESATTKKLLKLIEEVPDCNHVMLGRWFTLTKKNEGVGVGGYELSIGHSPSPAGFEFPQSPNYATWGKGNPAKGNPGSRGKSYATIEAIGSDPEAWYAKELRSLGICLTDAEAAAADSLEGAPF